MSQRYLVIKGRPVLSNTLVVMVQGRSWFEMPRNRHGSSRSPLLKERAITLQSSFSVLKLSADPTFEELRERYIDQAKIYHPDSGNVAADHERFTELQEAYRVVHSHLRCQDEDDEDGDDSIDDDHIAPQHRQYLNYGGFGFGPPSQREKVYRQRRVLKAFEKVSDHKVKQLADKPTPDGRSLTLRAKRSVKRSKVTNAIERLVEDLIQESMSKGDFDNLPGKGKPLRSKTEYCPFIDIGQHNLNQVLVNNGVVPEFVALQKEIRDLLSNSKSKLYKERLKLGPEPLSKFNRKKWGGLTSKFSEDVSAINRKISHFNLVVPLIRLQKVFIRPEKEVEKVLDLYKDHEKNLIESEKLQTEDKPMNVTFNILAVVNQITERVFRKLLRQSMNKD